jgi:hypothetical protein
MNSRSLAILLLGTLMLLTGCGQRTLPEQATMLRYEEGPQVEIISPGGTHVLIDVLNPALLTQPPGSDDLLLTTDMHNPIDGTFARSFPGQQLMTRAGAITQGDVSVQGIASAIGTHLPLLAENGSNYIYVVETGGLRIVHFGIIGQDALNAEQLAALGRVDVALMPLSYPFSQVTAANRKAFTLMDQVRPRVIVPTQFDEASARIAVAHWAGAYTDSPALALTPSALPERTTVIFSGAMGAPMGKLLQVPALEGPLAP